MGEGSAAYPPCLSSLQRMSVETYGTLTLQVCCFSLSKQWEALVSCPLHVRAGKTSCVKELGRAQQGCVTDPTRRVLISFPGQLVILSNEDLGPPQTGGPPETKISFRLMRQWEL